MSRRKRYSEIRKNNRVRTNRAKGKGDVLYRGFECLNPICSQYITVTDEDCQGDFKIVCPRCGYQHVRGGKQKLFDYDITLKVKVHW